MSGKIHVLDSPLSEELTSDLEKSLISRYLIRLDVTIETMRIKQKCLTGHLMRVLHPVQESRACGENGMQWCLWLCQNACIAETYNDSRCLPFWHLQSECLGSSKRKSPAADPLYGESVCCLWLTL